MKEDFFKYQAQTSPHPLALEIQRAEGSYIFDTNNRPYLDFIAGVSANSLGHNHPKVKQAILHQLNAYTHVMVYGEFIQEPQTKLCAALARTLPDTLSAVYLVNSGTEATEGALKLAKRVTGRSQFVAAKRAYHGNTQGAMSVCGEEAQNAAFRPLIPGIHFMEFNKVADLDKISEHTAAVILETIQGGAGFIRPENDYLKKVKQRCVAVGALLILDEIQSGIGRTGPFWGFENYDVVPDIIVAGKGLGGGMPIGAFIANSELMEQLKDRPKLGHITTFGGHPVIAAAAFATIQTIQNEQLGRKALDKETLFRKRLVHPLIKEIRGKGLMLALVFESDEIASKLIVKALDQGLLLFWLLYDKKAVRITPALTITEDEIKAGCAQILTILDDIVKES